MCSCGPECGVECPCASPSASGFGCQARCDCKGKCSNGAEVKRQRIQNVVDIAHGTKRPEDANLENKRPESKSDDPDGREVKTMSVEGLQDLLKGVVEKMDAMQEQMNLLLGEKNMIKRQLDMLSKKNAEVKQELSAQESAFKSLAERVKATETKGAITAVAQQVAKDVANMPPLPVLLITGLKEAEDWEQDEGAHIMGYLQSFGCADGVTRVERLGRRVRHHKGGGRFILAECTEAGAQRLRGAASRLEKKGVGVRVSNRGFRAERPKPVAQASRASAGPHALSASATPLIAPGEEIEIARPPPPSTVVRSDHAKLVCRPFQKGECPDIRKCKHAHVRVCLEYAEKGVCRFADAKGNGCKFYHIKWDEDVGGWEWRGVNR